MKVARDRHGRWLPASMTIEERFWPKVDRSGGVDACWLWTGCRIPQGYGQIWRDGRMESAHRVAYELSTGGNPGELHVMHSCDNPPCVNPAHLSAGTNVDNMDDRDAKGRTLAGDRHPRSKLTGEIVAEMRRERLATGRTFESFAAQYGVTSAACRLACQGKTWRTVAELLGEVA